MVSGDDSDDDSDDDDHNHDNGDGICDVDFYHDDNDDNKKLWQEIQIN